MSRNKTIKPFTENWYQRYLRTKVWPRRSNYFMTMVGLKVFGTLVACSFFYGQLNDGSSFAAQLVYTTWLAFAFSYVYAYECQHRYQCDQEFIDQQILAMEFAEYLLGR